MTEPFCVDPASAAINIVIDVMKEIFAPDAVCPVLGGGTTTVHFVAGEGAVWDPLAEGGEGCADPFIWVRLVNRYRTAAFPEPAISLSPCGDTKVIAVEIGVGRCVNMDADIDWDVNAREAEIGLDDSWHLSRALCLINKRLKDSYQVGIDTITPYGPEGGGIVWMTIVYIGFVT